MKNKLSTVAAMFSALAMALCSGIQPVSAFTPVEDDFADYQVIIKTIAPGENYIEILNNDSDEMKYKAMILAIFSADFEVDESKLGIYVPEGANNIFTTSFVVGGYMPLTPGTLLRLSSGNGLKLTNNVNGELYYVVSFGGVRPKQVYRADYATCLDEAGGNWKNLECRAVNRQGEIVYEAHYVGSTNDTDDDGDKEDSADFDEGGDGGDLGGLDEGKDEVGTVEGEEGELEGDLSDSEVEDGGDSESGGDGSDGKDDWGDENVDDSAGNDNESVGGDDNFDDVLMGEGGVDQGHEGADADGNGLGLSNDICNEGDLEDEIRDESAMNEESGLVQPRNLRLASSVDNETIVDSVVNNNDTDVEGAANKGIGGSVVSETNDVAGASGGWFGEWIWLLIGGLALVILSGLGVWKWRIWFLSRKGRDEEDEEGSGILARSDR